MKKDILTLATAAIIFLSGIYSFATCSGFILDSAIYLAMLMVIYRFYDLFNLNLTVLAFLCSAFIIHHVMAFTVQYTDKLFGLIYADAFLHFYTHLVFAMLFFRMLLPYFDRGWTAKNFFLSGMVVLTTLGMGAVIELIEFIGLAYMGPGSGTFFQGATEINHINDPGAAIAGVTYIDTMWDLVDDLAGALLGVVANFIRR